MRDFQVKRKTNRWLYWLGMVFLFILLVAMGKGVWGLVQKNQMARDNYNEAENRLVELEKEKKQLMANVAILKTERGIETEIRKNFSVAKEGERVITIVDNNQTAATTTGDDNDSAWSWFINIFK